MKKISAEIIADSVNPHGDRITSFILTYPRFIHAELMTHRLFSRNSASSRAIPFAKMIEEVTTDPFIPIAWQTAHKGMQGTQYLTKQSHIDFKRNQWLHAQREAVREAQMVHAPIRLAYSMDEDPHQMIDTTITKQLCNRILEPFMWHTVLVTATEYDNFFELRCPKYYYEPENKYFRSKKDYSAYWFDCFGSGIEEVIEGDPVLWWLNRNHSQAEIHIQALAEAMWDARNESKPVKLKDGDWHIPFGDKIFSENGIEECLMKQPDVQWVSAEGHDEELNKLAIKIATARCARLSYMTFNGDIDYVKDIALHDTLLASHHMSPFEHCAKVMTNEEYVSFVKGYLDSVEIDEPDPGEYVAYLKSWSDDPSAGWCNNFKGFIPYRWFIENGRI